MKKKVREGWQVLAAKAVLPRLSALQKEIPLLPKTKDIECVHRMRVASRRLRSALGIFETYLGKKARKWRKQARWITGVLGTARDLDVQMDFVRGYLENLPKGPLRRGPKRLLRRLQKERREAQTALLGALDELESSGLIETVEKDLESLVERARKHGSKEVRPLRHGWARAAVRARIRDLLWYKRYVPDPKYVKELHEMRIAAKRLRYTLEVFAPYHGKEITAAVSTVKRLQELLGDIHDADVWVENLPRLLEDERRSLPDTPAGKRRLSSIARGLEHMQENRQQERERVYRNVLRYWRKLEKEDTWNKLVKKLKTL